MRILEVNKFMFGGGGAETAMFSTAELLEANGHEVGFFAMDDSRNRAGGGRVWLAPMRSYSAETSVPRRARDALASIYSRAARAVLSDAIDQWRPDVAHVHNIYHQLTLSLLDELRVRRIPVVMTVHDYKPVCPNYMLYTNDGVCHRCVGRHLPLPAIRHRCIKGSVAASVVGFAESAVVKVRSCYDSVDCFIAPSRFMAEVLTAGHIPAERIVLLRNFVTDAQLARGDAARTREGVAYLGRLEKVKGVMVLAEAARACPNVKVVVAGRGSLEPDLIRLASDGIVDYRGLLDWPHVRDLIDTSCAVVVPSLWEENCPMIILEAGARGCPVIVSDRGGLPELVASGADGLIVQAGDPEALAKAIARLSQDPLETRRLGDARFARTMRDHGATEHYGRLMTIFDAVVADGASGKRRQRLDPWTRV